ncbi:MAG: formylglycine-generating enzyme family protein [Anaerolineae bacterium]|nr:formylglycine-generating enzyme family protein [Anaerolineae bacterium]
MKSRIAIIIALVCSLIVVGCTPETKPTAASLSTETGIPTQTATDTPTATATDTPMPSATPTPSPTPTGTPLPVGFAPLTHNADWTSVIEEKNGVPMALVPAGCFQMGSTGEEVSAAFALCNATRDDCQLERFEAELPRHEVCFDEPFWIDVFEVSNAQYGSWTTYGPGNLPRENLTWFDAQAHCESRGARLPTEAEWEYAARGPDGLAFPWGNDFNGGLLNFCDVNCPFVDWADTGIDDGYEYAAPVGSYPGGVSWVGAYDLSGNAWEWVNDWYDSGYYAVSPGTNPQGPDGGEYRSARGGGWYFETYFVRAAYRDWIIPDLEYYRVGFRCALSHNP